MLGLCQQGATSSKPTCCVDNLLPHSISLLLAQQLKQLLQGPDRLLGRIWEAAAAATAITGAAVLLLLLWPPQCSVSQVALQYDTYKKRGGQQISCHLAQCVVP